MESLEYRWMVKNVHIYILDIWNFGFYSSMKIEFHYFYLKIR